MFAPAGEEIDDGRAFAAPCAVGIFGAFKNRLYRGGFEMAFAGRAASFLKGIFSKCFWKWLGNRNNFSFEITKSIAQDGGFNFLKPVMSEAFVRIGHPCDAENFLFEFEIIDVKSVRRLVPCFHGIAFTFQDFMGFGVYLGPRRQFNVGVKINHYSNGNIFTENAGVKIPYTFNLGYTF